MKNNKRLELSPSEFGLPDKRKYPLDNVKHICSAIKFFNYVDEEDEAELARNVKRKAKEFNVVIRCGKGNRLSKYINKEYVNELVGMSDMLGVINGTLKQHIHQNNHIISSANDYPYTKKIHKDELDAIWYSLSTIGSLDESSVKIPVYIIAYDYKSVFATTLKAATHSHYNHIAISLSPNLENAYTFARSINGSKSSKGFTKEPLSQMIEEHGDFFIKVNAVYVSKRSYDMISTMIKKYNRHKKDTSYNYSNLMRAAFGIKVDNDDLDNSSMNCSIFVDYILKNAGVDITDNPNSNLVDPGQLADADVGNDNVITVYYGNAKGYDRKKISKMKFVGESVVLEGKVKLPRKCKKCGSSNIGVFIKGVPVFLCKDCGEYNGDVPFNEEFEVDDDNDPFFDNIEKQFEDLEFEPIPTDVFHERKG